VKRTKGALVPNVIQIANAFYEFSGGLLLNLLKITLHLQQTTFV
jgi:hypothetical protein